MMARPPWSLGGGFLSESSQAGQAVTSRRMGVDDAVTGDVAFDRDSERGELG